MRDTLIRSSMDERDEDLLRLSSENKISLIYEMGGIYREYIGETSAEVDFKEYYIKKKGRTTFHYRNKGVQWFSRELHLQRVISKRNMKRYGKTYRGAQVVTSIHVLELTNSMLKYIRNNEDLYGVYKTYISLEDTLLSVTDFQYTFIDRYVNNAWGSKSRKFREMFNQLKAVDWR